MRRIIPEPGLPVASSATGDPAATSPINAMNSTPLSSITFRQKECSFTLLLVHRIIPKAIEFFLDHPADIPRA